MSDKALALTIERLYALRYLTIAGLTVLIYDSLLTWNEELLFIWIPVFQSVRKNSTRSLSVPRSVLLYLIARYSMLAIGLLYLFDLIPSRDLTINWPVIRQSEGAHQYYRCQGSMVFVFCVDVIVEVLSCGVVLHQLFQLWDFNPLISRIVLVTFFVAKVVLFAFAGAAIALIKKDITFMTVDNVHFCGATGSSRLFLGVWVTCVTFDVCSFALLLLNALSKPRSESQRLLKILYEDGILFFLTIFTMRSLNLIISAVAPPSLIILGIVFSASMVSTIVGRSFLRLQTRMSPNKLKNVYDGDASFLEGDEDGYMLRNTDSTKLDDNTMRSTASSSGY